MVRKGDAVNVRLSELRRASGSKSVRVQNAKKSRPAISTVHELFFVGFSCDNATSSGKFLTREQTLFVQEQGHVQNTVLLCCARVWMEGRLYSPLCPTAQLRP